MPPIANLIDIGGRQIDAKAQLLDLDRADCEDSLAAFLRKGWKYMDPQPYKHGWHIDAIAEHLQAVVDGEIRQLIINVPPRHCKSLLTSVAFPAWTWAQSKLSPTSGPGVPFLYASYDNRLSLRDSVKCRRLIESPWYQSLWGTQFQLTSDQNTKGRFTNSVGGERLITSIGAGVTGEGGNIIVVDDPNSAGDIESEATIETTIEWWTTAMPTRLNDIETGAFVIIQQRLAMNDLTGHILENEVEGWTHLCLPGRYEKERAYSTTIGWEDPRTEEGELLWPERFSEESMKRLEVKMGPYKFAGQIQQRPSPKGGGIIKDEWWQVWPIQQPLPVFDHIFATLDTAYTADSMNDPSGLCVWGIFSGGHAAQASRLIGTDGRPMWNDRTYIETAPKIMLIDSWKARLELFELVQQVAHSAKRFKIDLLIIENKASGISVAQEIRRLYSSGNFGVQLFDPKNQDKTARLYSVQHLFAEGLVFCWETEPNRLVRDEVAMFPKAPHDEFVDCTSMAMRYARDAGMLTRAPERLEALESLKAYPEKLLPLYSC